MRGLGVLLLILLLTAGCPGIGATAKVGPASVADEVQKSGGPFVASSYRVVVEWQRGESAKPRKVSCAEISAIHPTTRVEVQGMATEDGSKVFTSRVPLELWCSVDGGASWGQVKWAPQPDDIIANKYTVVHVIEGEFDPCERN